MIAIISIIISDVRLNIILKLFLIKTPTIKMMNIDKDKAREKGTMIVFSSFLYHRITPITEGYRYSIVGWISGPPWK